MDDYFAVEPLIVARLRERLSSNITVQPTWGIAKIQEVPELLPAVLVLLEADQPGEINLSGAAQKIEQIWTCIVVVKDAASEAGPLISQVIQALNGWKPKDTDFSPFRRIKSGFSHDYSPSTAFYFPLAFSTSFVFNV
ncbi:MAG: hypothetical protein HQM04_12455 [Magnetococcales bacterium]|nr:hypothetical protein [Magnetococcales bacterium]MBF0115836.1 hypothetical protein [Magnetococcales bacterium]